MPLYLAAASYRLASSERFPDHRHRNFKAFREHIKHQDPACSITEQYLYNLSWLGVRVVWKLFIQ